MIGILSQCDKEGYYEVWNPVIQFQVRSILKSFKLKIEVKHSKTTPPKKVSKLLIKVKSSQKMVGKLKQMWQKILLSSDIAIK